MSFVDWKITKIAGLRLQPTPKEDEKSVCASAKVLGGTCSTELAYADASVFCQSVGARLCSAEEVQGGVASEAADACGLANKFVWTSSLCEANQVVVTSSRSQSTTADTSRRPQCVSKSEKFNSICCADEATNHCATESPPCTNGGTCVNQKYNFTCECTEGFSGDRCQNVCTASTCLNGGECFELGEGQFSCGCPGDFAVPDHVRSKEGNSCIHSPGF